MLTPHLAVTETFEDPPPHFHVPGEKPIQIFLCWYQIPMHHTQGGFFLLFSLHLC